MAEADLLGLLGALQLGDSFFPSGLYTLSHGLESFVQAGVVTSAEELEGLLEDYVLSVAGPSDAVAASEAARAINSGDVDLVVEVDRLLWSMKLAHEAVVAACRTGRRLAALAADLSTLAAVGEYDTRVVAGEAPGTYAVGVGVLACAWGLQPEQAAAVELYSLVSGLLGAALRIVRMDHAQAQVILQQMRPSVAAVAARAARTSYLDMVAFAPRVDIMQMRHVEASVRLFAS
jgi:urease accessory protein